MRFVDDEACTAFPAGGTLIRLMGTAMVWMRRVRGAFPRRYAAGEWPRLGSDPDDCLGGEAAGKAARTAPISRNGCQMGQLRPGSAAKEAQTAPISRNGCQMGYLAARGAGKVAQTATIGCGGRFRAQFRSRRFAQVDISYDSITGVPETESL